MTRGRNSCDGGGANPLLRVFRIAGTLVSGRFQRHAPKLRPRKSGPVRWSFAAAAAAASALASTAAWAGPPFVTDDPEPTDHKRWEVYVYAGGAHVPGETAGEAGLDLNFGAAPDLQLTATLPMAFSRGDQAGIRRTQLGLGDVELGAKYRFIHQSKDGAQPDVSVFPRVIIPTGGRRFGTGRVQVLLPAWAQKDIGPWSVFGGGGYMINPGPGNRNFWVSGLAVSRPVSKRLVLGLEVYHQTADAEGGKPYTGVNVGALYRLTEHLSVIGSAGPGVQNAREGGQYAFYAALKLDY